MDEINDFERTTLRGLTLPTNVANAIKEKRCVNCDKVFFVNYTGNNYECHRCRDIDIRDFGISSKHS